MLSIRVGIVKTQATIPIALDNTRGITAKFLSTAHFIGGSVVATSVVLKGIYLRPIMVTINGPTHEN